MLPDKNFRVTVHRLLGLGNRHYNVYEYSFACLHNNYNLSIKLWSENVNGRDILEDALWVRRCRNIIHLYTNNCPTRCNTKQSINYSASSLYMFRVSTTPIIRSTQNCNYSLRYWSYFLYSYLPPTWSSLATLEGGSCTVPEAVVTVLCTPDDGCG